MAVYFILQKCTRLRGELNLKRANVTLLYGCDALVLAMIKTENYVIFWRHKNIDENRNISRAR